MKKYKYSYVTVAADPSDIDTSEQIHKLLKMLTASWELVSAVGVAGGVHYILRTGKNHERTS